MSVRVSGYTTYKIGPNQELTPEGFLLCKDVPVARTGVMYYGPNETPIEAGSDGVVKIFRSDEDVFNEITIASAIGKPVTNDHPDVDVTPDNWKAEAHGVALNVRRGEGAMDDLLLMDLLITTKEGIEAVQNGKREISLGYDADYEETGHGTGKQSNIIINHIALVEDGRCGARCAIKDHKLIINEVVPMAIIKRSATKQKGLAKVLDLLFRAHSAKDSEELGELANEIINDEDFSLEERTGELPDVANDEASELGGLDGETHVHIHTGEKITGAGEEYDEGARASFVDSDLEEHINQNTLEHSEFRSRLDAIEAKLGLNNTDEPDVGFEDDGEELEEFLEDEAPEGIPARDARKARDSRYLGESMKDTVAMAEILVPGIRVPTYDRMAKPAQTAKKICGMRRQALDQAYALPVNRSILNDLLGNKTLDTSRMTCDAIRTLFRSAAALKRQSNNNAGVRDSVQNFQFVGKKEMTIEEINRINQEYYSSRK